MSDIITTLHPGNDENTNLYPNIKKENIPDRSIDTNKLNQTVLDLIGSLKPSGTDTSTNILAFTTNKGIYVATDNNHWYYWDGTQYVDGGLYQSGVNYDEIAEYINYGTINPEYIDGIFIYYSNGNIGNEGAYSSTDFIEIVSNFYYKITCRVTSTIVGYAFYDEDHNYIIGGSLYTTEAGVDSFVVLAPKNAKYLRYTTLKVYKDSSNYSIDNLYNIIVKINSILKTKIGSTDLAQQEGNSSTDAMSQKAISDIFDFSSVTQFPTNSEDFGIVTDGKYCNPDNGNISNVSSYKTLDINLTNVIRIFDSYSNRNYLNYDSIVFFNENNEYISGYQPVLESQSEQIEYNGYYGVYFVIPSNAKRAVINLIKNRDNYRYTRIFTALKITKIPTYLYGDAFKGKKVINFGDSIFGNYRDTNDTYDKSISKMIEEMTDGTVYNAGFGGCRMSNGYQYWDAFSMDNISNSIYDNNWSEQEQALVDGSGDLPSYFVDTVNMLKQINFKEIDYITIGYGTNDYSGNIDLTTFGNALKHSIEKILSKYPNIRIVVISPCWRWWASGGVYSYSSDDAQSENTHGDKLIDYVDKCKEVCEQYHIAFVDTYRTLGFNQYTATTYFDGTDGTHPNQKGRQLRAERIVGQINSLFN